MIKSIIEYVKSLREKEIKSSLIKVNKLDFRKDTVEDVIPTIVKNGSQSFVIANTFNEDEINQLLTLFKVLPSGESIPAGSVNWPKSFISCLLNANLDTQNRIQNNLHLP